MEFELPSPGQRASQSLLLKPLEFVKMAFGLGLKQHCIQTIVCKDDNKTRLKIKQVN